MDANTHAMASTSATEKLIVSLHYAYPSAVFVYFLISSAIAICTLQTSTGKDQHVRRGFLMSLMLCSILTYLVQVVSILVRSLLAKSCVEQQDTIISLLSCILVFGVQLAGLSETEHPAWHPYIGSYIIGLVLEPVIVALTVAYRPQATPRYAHVVDIATTAFRESLMLGVVFFYCRWRKWLHKEEGNDLERQSLLQKSGLARGALVDDSEDTRSTDYGSASDDSTDASQSPTDNPESPWERRERESREAMEKRLKENGNWFAYAKSFFIFFPYVWPVKHTGLQIRVVLVACCLLAKNSLNVLIPRQLGIVTDSLSRANSANPWVQVLIYAALKFAASEAGISLLRQWLWIPVEFYSSGALSTAAYSHVLNLSSDFHDSKSSSDIMMAIQSGQSVSNMLESVCFSAIPMLIDMVVAFIYLSVTFGPYEGLITIATSIIFLYIATRMISRLRSARRNEVSAFFEEHYVRQAGIQGWTTVTSFNQIGHEEKRYSAVVKDKVSKSQAVYFGYLVANAFQYLVLLAGLLAGAFLAVFQVTRGEATPGQFIMLLTYWAQLVAPLHFFASLGKNISRDLIHAEQLLKIMKTKPTVVNKDGAIPLEFTGGNVDFESVYFSYDKKKQILKNIDFSVPAGTTVAFVGATGAGKSTILKLLDRFYDVTEGSILIDGQDIRDVDLFSLRSQIGVVPQNPTLFDDTIMNNVRYAKLNASDEEVYEACKAAAIHDQIIGFTDGYNTRVGERGMKLSGGELQRVAIARAILKRPSIVLLDEATSAVDTETEQKIQEALRVLCQGRTTFIVAHRLSTIMNADHIVVVSGGEVIEQGNHEQLIRQNGKYAELWSKQIFVKPKGNESTNDKAKGKLRKAPNIVNDLSPEMTSLELAKVTITPTPLSLDPVGSNTTKKDIQQQERVAETMSSEHKKEDYKLNPDAPPFTPRSMIREPATIAGLTLKTATAELPLDSSQPAAVNPSSATPIQCYATTPMVVLPPAPPAMRFADLAGDASGSVLQTIEEGTNENTPNDDSYQTAGVGTNAPEGGKAMFKHPRYSRRVQSKSEPNTGNSVQDT